MSPSASAVRMKPQRCRAAEVLLRDRGPEHALGAELDGVHEAELERRSPTATCAS